MNTVLNPLSFDVFNIPIDSELLYQFPENNYGKGNYSQTSLEESFIAFNGKKKKNRP